MESNQQFVQKLENLKGKTIQQYFPIINQATNTKQFYSKVYFAISNPHISPQIKLKASSFLSFCMLNRNQTTPHKFSQIRKFLLDKNIHSKYKFFIRKVLDEILSTECKSNQINQFQNIANQLLMSQSIDVNIISSMLYSSIIQSSSLNIDIAEIVEFFKNTLEKYVNIGNKLMNQLLEITQKKDLNYIFNKNSNADLQQCLANLKNWIRSYFQFFNYLSELRNQSTDASFIISKECSNQFLFQIFLTIYQFSFRNQKLQIFPYPIFSIGLTNYDQQINQIKEIVLQIHYKMILNYQSFQDHLFQNDHSLIVLKYLLPKLIQNLKNIWKPDIYHIYRYHLEQIIVSSILLLTKSISFTYFTQLFCNQYKKILLYIVFPALKIQQQQIIQFKQNPQQFYDNYIGLIQQKNAINLKTSISYLLRTLVENIDGAASYAFYSALGAIKYILNIGPSLQIFQDFKDTNYKPTLQNSMTILSLIGFLFIKRTDLLQLLNKFFNTVIFSNFTGIEKAKFLCLLIYHFDTRKIPQNCNILKDYLIWASTTEQQQYACSIYADQFLLSYFHSDYGIQIWTFFINKIKKSKLVFFFNALQTLIDRYIQQLDSNYVVQLSKSLCQRLFIEFQQKNQKTQIFNKLIHLITDISLRTDLLINDQNIMQSIWPISIFIEKKVKIVFIDQIIAILNNLLKTTYQISKREFQMVESLKVLIKEQDYQFMNLIQIIHNFIARSRSYIQNQPSQFKKLEEIIQLGFLATIPYVIGQNCILMQQLFIVYGDIIIDWDYYTIKTQQIFNLKISEQINARIINSWLIGYHYNKKFPIHILIEQQIFFKDYDAQLCISTVGKLIQTQACSVDLMKQLIIVCIKIYDNYKKIYDDLKNSRMAKKLGKNVITNKTLFRATYDYIIYQLQLLGKRHNPGKILNQMVHAYMLLDPDSLYTLTNQLNKVNINQVRLRQLVSFIKVENTNRKILKINRKSL